MKTLHVSAAAGALALGGLGLVMAVQPAAIAQQRAGRPAPATVPAGRLTVVELF